MKRLFLILVLLPLFKLNTMAQPTIGFGGELTLVSARLAGTLWLSNIHGFEVFGGPAAELQDFKPNDWEAGVKYMHTVIYTWNSRLYLGALGKWKWVNPSDSRQTTSLPEYGFFIGHEWSSKRIHLKSLAIELGYQMGEKDYPVLSPINHFEIGKETFEEFPLILSIKYNFVQKIKKSQIKRY